MPLIRKSVAMQLKAGKEEEYRASHNEGFWPEMAEALKAHGAHNYHIALHPGTRQLFAYVEIEDEARWAAIASSDVCKRWWAWMTEFIEFKADGTPDAVELKEMFFFDPKHPQGRAE